MNKLEQLKIKYFRGLKDVNLDKFVSINILVGENNTGKTSILEVIKLIANPLSPFDFSQLSRSREKAFIPLQRSNTIESIKWLFPKDGNKVNPIEISFNFNEAKHDLVCELEEIKLYVDNDLETNSQQQELIVGEEELVTELKVFVKYRDTELEHVYYDKGGMFKKNPSPLTDGLFNCEFITSVEHRLMPVSSSLINRIIKEGRREELVKTLQFFDENIYGIELLMDNRRPNVYLNHKELGVVPISIFGDGLRKALLVAAKILGSEGGVLLIDEIEIGIHTSLIPDFMEWISLLCKKFEVQLFATTHSLETVDGILKANLNNLDGLSFYRLRDKETSIQIRHFTGDKMKDIRYEFGQDVR